MRSVNPTFSQLSLVPSPSSLPTSLNTCRDDWTARFTCCVMSESEITHACVHFIGLNLHKIVPLSSVQDFHPKNESDFMRNRIYRVWRNGTGAANGDVLLKAHVLLLGDSESAVQRKRDGARLKIPNKRKLSLNASTSSGKKNKQTTVKPAKNMVRQKPCENPKDGKNAATRNVNKEILDKYNKFVAARPMLDDFEARDEEDVDDPPPTNPKRPAEVHMPGFFVLRPPPAQEEDECPNSSNQYSSSINHKKQSSGRNLQNSVNNRSSSMQEGRESVDPVVIDQRSPTTSRREEPQEGCNLRNSANDRSHFVEHERRTPTSRYPRMALRAAPEVHRRAPACGPAQLTQQVPRRRDVPQELVEVHTNITIERDTWEVLLSQKDSRFVKDVAMKIWGSVGLAERCVDDKRANKHNKPGEQPRPPLTPVKYESLKDCLFYKITDAGVTGRSRAYRMRRIWDFVSHKIYDERKKLGLT